ncbi:unnamed protein product [Gadus morhua 'NCC']
MEFTVVPGDNSCSFGVGGQVGGGGGYSKRDDFFFFVHFLERAKRQGQASGARQEEETENKYKLAKTRTLRPSAPYGSFNARSEHVRVDPDDDDATNTDINNINKAEDGQNIIMQRSQ